MELLEASTQDQGYEKHVPVIEKEEDVVRVKIGSVEHPMEEEHYIEWVELIADGKRCRKFLNPGDKPEAVFPYAEAKELSAREYCNVHGLWQSS